MTWLMPVQLLPFAGLLALAFAGPWLSKAASHVKLFAGRAVRVVWEGGQRRPGAGLIGLDECAALTGSIVRMPRCDAGRGGVGEVP